MLSTLKSICSGGSRRDGALGNPVDTIESAKVLRKRERVLPVFLARVDLVDSMPVYARSKRN
jgi:hypothetical protein